jgi:hypothetical protein
MPVLTRSSFVKSEPGTEDATAELERVGDVFNLEQLAFLPWQERPDSSEA